MTGKYLTVGLAIITLSIICSALARLCNQNRRSTQIILIAMHIIRLLIFACWLICEVVYDFSTGEWPLVYAYHYYRNDPGLIINVLWGLLALAAIGLVATKVKIKTIPKALLLIKDLAVIGFWGCFFIGLVMVAWEKPELINWQWIMGIVVIGFALVITGCQSIVDHGMHRISRYPAWVQVIVYAFAGIVIGAASAGIILPLFKLNI